MSSQPDYNFNQPVSAPSEGGSLQLPFALLSTAIAVMMIAQTVNVFKVHSALSQDKAQLADAYRNREGAVKQSGEVQHNFLLMASDLTKLGETDKDAAALAKKYFQQTGAAPAAEPAK